MAATRLIALHINKGKTIAQTLADRTDYSKNEEKTEGGKYISQCWSSRTTRAITTLRPSL